MSSRHIKVENSRQKTEQNALVASKTILRAGTHDEDMTLWVYSTVIMAVMMAIVKKERH